MKLNYMILKTCAIVPMLCVVTQLHAQIEPHAGSWKTWFIPSGKDYRLSPPSSPNAEITEILRLQQELDSAGMQEILYWNAGAPGYRWQNMMGKLWMYDTSYNGALANMLLNVAIYDATIAAWDTKYAYPSPRPYQRDQRIKTHIPEPGSPTYPCEHAVVAGAASTIIAHFYPSLADSVHRMAERAMKSRVTAGVAFQGDTRAGFALGKHIAEIEIAATKDFIPKQRWEGKMPEQPGVWKGKNPMFPLAGLNKTVVLDSSSQFRPGPPPDFAKDMEELKKFKQTFRSRSNAFHYANQAGDDLLHKKIFEYNIHLNPPRAAWMYALNAIGIYDGFVACWDAKYTYWGIRPDQYDTTYHALIPNPPFPAYPSGHAVIGGMTGELYSYFFPAERALFQKIAKEGADSRFHAGIHFRTDNEVGLELGRKVAQMVIQKAESEKVR